MTKEELEKIKLTFEMSKLSEKSKIQTILELMKEIERIGVKSKTTKQFLNSKIDLSNKILIHINIALTITGRELNKIEEEEIK